MIFKLQTVKYIDLLIHANLCTLPQFDREKNKNFSFSNYFSSSFSLLKPISF